MKVLALDHSPELGGAEIGLTHLANELAPHLEVAVFQDGPFAERLRAHGHVPRVLGIERGARSLHRGGGPAARLRASFAQASALRRTLTAAVEDSGASVLMINTLRAALLTALSGVRLDLPVVVMIRDGLRPPYLSAPDAIASQLLVSLRASAVVANSEWTRSTLRVLRPTHVVAPALARDLFEPVRPRQDDVVRVLVLGRLAAWKGQHVALAAAGLVRTSTPWSLTVAGAPWFDEHDYASRLEGQAAALDVDIEFTGHVDDVRALIDAHDIVIHSSVMPEPFGQVVAQGMARGKVVIASDAGGPAEIVDGGTDGLLVPPGDVRALADALELGISDNELRRRLGAGARRSAARYHPEVTTGEFLAVVDGVVGRRRSRSVAS